jgi:hypothetical protein
MTKKTKINESIAFLIEAELERFEVILAAKSITDDLQEMAVKIAKMEAEDVMPLSDALTTNFSIEQSRAFSDAVGEALRGLTEKIKEVRDAVGAQIARLEGNETGEPMNDLTAPGGEDPTTDSDLDAMGDENGEDGFDIDWDDDGTDQAAPTADAMEPQMGSDEIDDTKHAAGRARKESAQPKKKMLEADRALAREFSKMLKEGYSTAMAAQTITETYMISVDDLIGILTSLKDK